MPRRRESSLAFSSWLQHVGPSYWTGLPAQYQYTPTLDVPGRFTANYGTRTGTIQYRNVPGLPGVLAHENVHALQQIGPRGNLLQEFMGAVPRTVAGTATPLQRGVAAAQTIGLALSPIGGAFLNPAEAARKLNEVVAYGTDPNLPLNRALLNLVYPRYIIGPEPEYTPPPQVVPAAQTAPAVRGGNVRTLVSPHTGRKAYTAIAPKAIGPRTQQIRSRARMGVKKV